MLEVERRGLGVLRIVGTTRARGARGRAHGDVVVHVLSRRASWARVCLCAVVHLSTNGGHMHAQEVKWRQ
jgi:hypothetical protein